MPIRSCFYSTAKKVLVVCKDVSLRGCPRGDALDQHDKTRVVLLCPSARTFLFYSEKKSTKRKRRPLPNRSAGKGLARRCFPSALWDCMALVCCLCCAAICLPCMVGDLLVFLNVRIHIYDSKRCHHGLGIFSTVSSWAGSFVVTVFLVCCRRSGDRAPQWT